MTDYIQWLLEETGEIPPEDKDETTESLHRHTWMRRWKGRAPAEADGGNDPKKEKSWLAASEQTAFLSGEEGDEGRGQLGRRNHLWNAVGTTAEPGVTGEEQAEMGERRTWNLYRSVRQAERAEQWLQGSGTSANGGAVREEPLSRVEALGPRELDRFVEREARRYDNGLSLF